MKTETVEEIEVDLDAPVVCEHPRGCDGEAVARLVLRHKTFGGGEPCSSTPMCRPHMAEETAVDALPGATGCVAHWQPIEAKVVPL